MTSVRVSTLEAFRRWKLDELSTIEMVAAVRGTRRPTEAMRAGTALHAILEAVQPGYVVARVERDGYAFEFDADCHLSVEPIRELAGETIYEVDGENVEVTGHCDGIGQSICDHKLTGRFDHERYTDSAQWRLYLDIFGADRFVYNCFEADPSADWKRWRVFGFHQLIMYRYPGMESDNCRLVAEFVEFAKRHLCAQSR